MHDVYVFGDSHWRVFFPFVNHGSPGVIHEQDGIRMIDMVANELSGATMYGLLNDSSKNGARRRILHTLDDLGGVENVALTFGEVDARYHSQRYVVNGMFSAGRAFDLLARFKRFIDEDLIFPERVRSNVFVYTGYRYPKCDQTLLQPGQPIGNRIASASFMNGWMKRMMPIVLCNNDMVKMVFGDPLSDAHVSDDGVHLIPERIFPQVFAQVRDYLK